MTKPQREPPELFTPERPVRSDFSRRSGLSYKARRRITLTVLSLLLIAGLAWLWDTVFPSTPGEIPTIKAEGSYKQRPEEPGGIDIPHQDVQVYHEIDGSASAENAKPAIEHMLPPPEEPKAPAAPPPSASVEPAPAAEVENLSPAVQAEMTVATPPVAGTPAAQAKTPLAASPAAPSAVAPPVIQTPPPVAAAPAAEPPKPAPAETGNVVVQLAALPNEHAATAMAQKLQAKYQSILGSARLHPVRADLGAKGIFYRIQSQPLPESQAKSVCAALKNQNAGCLLVRR